jgi:hypothetical protein
MPIDCNYKDAEFLVCHPVLLQLRQLQTFNGIEQSFAVGSTLLSMAAGVGRW